MVKLTDGQRAVLVQSFPAIGHLAVGGLVFGQFLRDQPYSPWLATAGLVIWIACVATAVALAGGQSWIKP